MVAGPEKVIADGAQPRIGVTLKPYVRYVGAPNNVLAPVGTKEPADAVVVGLQATVNLGELLQMPHFVAH